MRGLIQVLLVASVALLASAQEGARTKDDQPSPGIRGQYQIETAKVEEALKITDDGYRFVAYIVTWHGERVVVSDPLAQTDYAPGDEISFMVNRGDLPGHGLPDYKLLSFMINKSFMRRPGSAK